MADAGPDAAETMAAGLNRTCVDVLVDGWKVECEAVAAQTAYSAAAQRLTEAIAALLAVGVPITPGRPGQVREWSRADVEVQRELHLAMGNELHTRRRWDGLRRPTLDRR